MRIGFVTQWFPPEPGIAVAAAIAEGLAARGHEVDVLTGFPNYPTGKLQDGYPIRPYRRETHAARVTIHRAPLYPSHNSSPLKRFGNYASFAAGAAWVSRRHLPTPDVWLVYSSPATSIVPAVRYRRQASRPICLIVQDLWPDSVMESGFFPAPLHRIVKSSLDRFCSWSYRQSAGIGVISPSMQNILVERGVQESKIFYTPNWGAASFARDELPLTRSALGLPSGRLFMYAGNMAELQGLEPLVRAFSRVNSVSLALVGAGVGRTHLERVVRDEQITNVRFVDAQPTHIIGRYIKSADVAVISLKDTPLLRATMPSKVQSSLAAGKPLLVHAGGDVASLTRSRDVGRACQPGDLNGTVSAIRELGAMPEERLLGLGRRSRALYEEEFSSKTGIDRLERLLQSATSGEILRQHSTGTDIR